MPLVPNRHDLLKLYFQEGRRRRYFSRTAQSCASPYPFPNSPEPTPYQIFHLPPDASPADVKQRYYELVKLYHPDSAESRLREPDPAQRHAHFSAITRAYARLQKRPAGSGSDFEAGNDSQPANPWARTSFARGRRYEEPSFVDDRWKDRLIWGGLIFAFASVGTQSMMVHRRRTQAIEEHALMPSSTASIGSNHKQLDNPIEDTLRLSRSKS